ncbi:cytochrome o ubiquinol oxidase subunit IV [Hyphomicrobium sp.]|uniref:cytochrome o ubiquinol oxidase subunit IV n=1 Tax=Hyphomicrobium sp. TaxID=82 RepID=UPI0025BF8478|nr:cytochrome o ubiquinol oxidase subunit IV [Hyphomicrobium sp.]MCC7254013.1 cytochrome o ubiquinol oxidase subunit IV [Hyphomicrobium sp.]
MSAPNAGAHTAHAEAGHDHHPAEGHAHGSLRGYLIGFALSVFLTAVPFWLVMGEVLESKQLTAFVIMAFAMVQIVVHIVFFLHMTSSAEEGWSMMALIFTLIIIVIAMAGSLWVMHHLNTNTMPFHDMRQML